MKAVRKGLNFFLRSGSAERVFFSALLFCLLFPVSAFADCSSWIARVVSMQGTVDIRAKGSGSWNPAKLQQAYCVGDVIRVGAGSRAGLELHNDTILRLNQNTTLLLSGPRKDDSWVDLIKGSIHAITRVPRSLKIKTPFVNAAVEGTEFLVRVDYDHTLVGVIEGKVAVTNEFGRLLLVQNQSAVTYKGKAPVLRLDIKPTDSVQWSLYYPVLDVAGLKQVEALLKSGQVNAAQAALKGKKSAEAMALRSIIAVARNNKDQALKLAEQAVQKNSRSVAAHLSHSYALQSRFNLGAALGAALKAVQSDPGHAMAWARVAELHLSLGQLEQGLAAAQKAEELQSGLARTRTILGFAYLLQYETDKARRAFRHSIKLDSSDPLARLGNGLATIRDGDLKQGRREIEIAASLDTSNALIRSYLGKAYYEEGRYKLAADQFALAKQMDPKDPTPWLYDAIRKQSENNPVGALHDMQKSVALNNSRAVYRSRLALDNDDAARSVNMARLYQELGFDQLGLVEARRSVDRDPFNYSSHRYLADAYRSRPRHEIARVSELLQAQLMQPRNVKPIQPQLAESSLGIVNGAGGVPSSLNEYNNLFVRNQFSFFIDGLTGSNETRANDVIHSGIIDKVTYSVGRYHYFSEGYRANNDQKYNIDNAFIQVALTPRFNIQFEYRDTERRNGDLSLNFDSTSFSATKRETRDSEVSRAGLSYLFSEHSRVIVSFLDRNQLTTQRIPGTFPSSDSSRQSKGNLFEIQHIYRSGKLSLISGGGRFRADSTTSIALDFSPFPCLIPSCLVVNPVKNKHDNLYVYSRYKLDNILITLGFSADSVKNELVDFSKINPKMGFEWDAGSGLSIRGSLFRYLKRDLISNQTIEPTQIAGFNQFFDDGLSTLSTVAGLAVDKKYSGKLFTGAQVFSRNMDVPYSASNQTFFAKWKEWIFDSYINWVPGNTYSVNAGLRYEQLKRPASLNSGVLKVNSYYLPLAVNYFYNKNIRVNLGGNFIRQRGEFYDSVIPLATTGSDSFFVADTEVRFRFSKSKGFFGIGVKNIFDRKFNFYEIDTATPRISRERFVYGSLKINL
ncbi:MAG TPA: tetratricopeptide repeat protein [Gammaproteobacteria bacterium]|nr:tetratricopeptide repeat protein [Gammaproteobacteria bacterium]